MKAFFITVLVAILAATLVSAGMTESDFKKMKVKDIRAFLMDRGLECIGCQEKSDFVRMAYQHRDKSPIGSAKKREIPSKKFWEAWSDIAKQECQNAVKRRGNDADAEPFSIICDTIHSAADSYLMQHGRRVANQLKKTPFHLLETSFKDVYYEAGLHLFQTLADYCLASPSSQTACQSLGSVLSTMDGSSGANFKVWTTNVGIENTNPMYDIIGEHADL
ncbi:Degradation arginine-rich protein for mis-folding, putative [Leishmania lindenbergi]|uniref:Degradation arginine-rich protein for mis-folding n=1 Tax=Leishmania lindenbergi TaxID=651832 RepID=A0AAW2ZUN1_9TRYP